MQRLTIKGFLNKFTERHRYRPGRPFCFVLGAGASKPSGIPTGQELVTSWLRKLYEERSEGDVQFEKWATAENLDIRGFELARAAESYPDVYEQRFPVEEDGFASLERLMDGKEPSYGYSVLAHLLSLQHKVVITTNFDNLVADALSIHAEIFPRIVGNDELVRYVDAELRRPLVAKIHGDLGFAPKNRRKEVSSLSEGWSNALTSTLGKFTPIFIGYSGGDGSLMGFLESLPEDTPDTMFWTHRADSPPNVRIQNLVEKHHGEFVEIEGFDELMMRILAALYEKPPDFAGALEDRSKKRVESYKKQKDALGAKIAGSKKPEPVGSERAGAGERHADDSDRQALLAAAGRVLTDSSTKKTWWEWQLEIDRSGDADAIDAKYLEAIEALPTSSELLGNYALFLQSVRKDADKAEDFYRRAIEADPKNAINLGNYAVFLQDVRKDADKAEDLYRRAIEADPKNANNLGHYAVFLQDVRQDYAKAEEHYRRSLEAEPGDATQLGNYGGLLFALGRSDDALPLLLRAEQAVDPSDSALRTELAFYRVAHVAESWPDGLAALKRLLAAGARSPGWPLQRNIERAEKGGHPQPDLLRAIAAVISDGAPIESLDKFPTWRDAK